MQHLFLSGKSSNRIGGFGFTESQRRWLQDRLRSGDDVQKHMRDILEQIKANEPTSKQINFSLYLNSLAT